MRRGELPPLCAAGGYGQVTVFRQLSFDTVFEAACFSPAAGQSVRTFRLYVSIRMEFAKSYRYIKQRS